MGWGNTSMVASRAHHEGDSRPPSSSPWASGMETGDTGDWRKTTGAPSLGSVTRFLVPWGDKDIAWSPRGYRSSGSSGTLLGAMMVWRATRVGKDEGQKAWNDRQGLGDEPCGDAQNFLRISTWRSLIIRKMSAPRVRPKERK
ncbi:hypothetical protein diail_11275 [Diaporthe ilicicola]|nr:hypothetical protein diail_11275 [Diaporthe ilicicola]